MIWELEGALCLPQGDTVFTVGKKKSDSQEVPWPDPLTKLCSFLAEVRRVLARLMM